MTARYAGPARAATIAALLALVASVLVRPLVAPSRVQAMGPLPACRYDDILTSPRGYADWSVTLVDTILRVPRSYAPTDLVHVSQAGIPGRGQIRAIVIDDLRAMNEAAITADAAIAVHSAYRSYDRQKEVFDQWVARFGYERALEVSARPGHSEHQLGLGLDFRSEPGGSPFVGNWGTTPAGKWMKAHSWEYGFILSYPKNKLDVVCYDFEPWHFRYVGRDVAAAVHASGLTLREYLWRNYTTTVVPGPTLLPGSTPKPPASPGASATAEPSPTVSPAASPGLSLAPTIAPSISATASAPLPTASTSPPAPTPTPSDPGGDGFPGASVVPPVAAGIALGLAGILLLGWMVLRRTRSP